MYNIIVHTYHREKQNDNPGKSEMHSKLCDVIIQAYMILAPNGSVVCANFKKEMKLGSCKTWVTWIYDKENRILDSS